MISIADYLWCEDVAIDAKHVYWTAYEPLRHGGGIYRRSYELKPESAELMERIRTADPRTKTLTLEPKKAAAKRIVVALKRGEKAKARLSVKLTDLAGNSETEKLRVRLKR